MRSLFVLFISLLCALQINAQQVITGKVMDDKDTPLPGVSVQVINTLRGTLSGMDGSYTISGTAFRYAGFQNDGNDYS